MRHAAAWALLFVSLAGCEAGRPPQWPRPNQSAIDRALSATVIVQTGGGLCAGYWADANTVVTAAHCVGGNTVSRVTSQGQAPFPAEVTFYDDAQDLALLSPLVTLDFGHEWLDTADVTPRAGDPIYAIGHPARFLYSVAGGIVAHPDREVARDDWEITGRFLQANMAIWFGNSGGPFIDLNGEVVGVASFFVENESLCFAVHYEVIEDALR